MFTTVLAGVSSILVAGLINLSESRAKNARARSALSGRELVFDNIVALARTPDAMRASGLSNPSLRACLFSGGAVCQAVGSGRFEAFTLFDERSVVRTGGWRNGPSLVSLSSFPDYLTELKTLTGFPAPQVRYDKQGRFCSSGSAQGNCSIGAYTSFRAWCPFPVNPSTGLQDRTRPRLTSCDKADFIQVFVAVGEPRTQVPLAAQKVAPPLAALHNVTFGSPSELGTNALRSSEILLSTDQIVSGGAMRCPTGMVSLGMDSNGFPRCDYTANPCATAENIASGRLIPTNTAQGGFACRRPLQGEACAGHQVLYGVRSNGGLDCREPRFATGCPNGQLVVRFLADGSPLCVRSHINTLCPAPAVLIAFDTKGNPICRRARTTFMGTTVDVVR